MPRLEAIAQRDARIADLERQHRELRSVIAKTGRSRDKFSRPRPDADAVAFAADVQFEPPEQEPDEDIIDAHARDAEPECIVG
jgi:hypothetical protein